MKCKYEGTGIYEGRCYGTKEIDPCPGYDKCSQFKPNFITNADYIRNMTDEELAELLTNYKIEICRGLGITYSDASAYKTNTLEFLRQPH